MSHLITTDSSPLELTWMSGRRDSPGSLLTRAENLGAPVVAVAHVHSVAQTIAAVTRTAPLGLDLRTMRATAFETDAPPAVFLDLRFPQPVLVEPNGAVLHVRPGATWTDILAATYSRGRAAPMPLDLLGDPLSFFLDAGLPVDGRMHGLASNRVRAVTVVTPAGEVVVVTPASEPELFWALRGGGGGFGVVVDVAVDLVPVAAVHRSAVAFHSNDPGRVLARWGDWCVAAPLTASSRVRLSADLDGGADVAINFWVVQSDVADFAATSQIITACSDLLRGLGVTAAASLDAVTDPGQRQVRGFLNRSDFDSWAASSALASSCAEVRQLGGKIGDEPSRTAAVDHVNADFLVTAERASAGDAALTPHRWVAEAARCERVAMTRTIVDPSGRFSADATVASPPLLNGPPTLGR